MSTIPTWVSNKIASNVTLTDSNYNFYRIAESDLQAREALAVADQDRQAIQAGADRAHLRSARKTERTRFHLLVIEHIQAADRHVSSHFYFNI